MRWYWWLVIVVVVIVLILGAIVVMYTPEHLSYVEFASLWTSMTYVEFMKGKVEEWWAKRDEIDGVESKQVSTALDAFMYRVPLHTPYDDNTPLEVIPFSFFSTDSEPITASLREIEDAVQRGWLMKRPKVILRHTTADGREVVWQSPRELDPAGRNGGLMYEVVDGRPRKMHYGPTYMTAVSGGNRYTYTSHESWQDYVANY
jgi:hypothetical protein